MERTALVAMSFGALVTVTVFAFIVVVSWLEQRRKEREALYQHETFRKIAEQQGTGGDRILEIMREQEVVEEWKRREGLKIGGLVTLAAGIGIGAFLAVLNPERAPLWGVGLIPAFIGAAILAYVYLMAPKPGSRA